MSSDYENTGQVLPVFHTTVKHDSLLTISSP